MSQLRACLCPESICVCASHFSLVWFFVTRLLCPWNSPGKNTGVGCHALLQGIFPTQGLNLGLLLLLHWPAGSLPRGPPGKLTKVPAWHNKLNFVLIVSGNQGPSKVQILDLLTINWDSNDYTLRDYAHNVIFNFDYTLFQFNDYFFCT